MGNGQWAIGNGEESGASESVPLPIAHCRLPCLQPSAQSAARAEACGSFVRASCPVRDVPDAIMRGFSQIGGALSAGKFG